MTDTLKFIGFSGSLRAGSFNSGALRAAQELCPEGVELEISDISGFPAFNQDQDADPPQMVTDLKAAGVPIHGVGLQAHWAINEPSAEQLDKTLARFAETGLKLQITELDISVYPKEHNARERKPEDEDTNFGSDRAQKQKEVYTMCFEAFRKYKQHITGVTFWNISDRSSWLDNFPVRGRKDYPLLFDSNLKPKEVYYQVVKF